LQSGTLGKKCLTFARSSAVKGSLSSMADAPEDLEKAAHIVRLRACARLMEWVAANAGPMTNGCARGTADLILLSIFARSTRTYEAIVRHLGEKAFGEQGFMLSRSLFEDMVDVHWVSLNEDLAVERLEQHDLYSRLLRADTRRAFPAMFDGQPPAKITVTNEQRKELRRLFGKSGSGSWTGRKSLDDVLECWKTEDDRQLVRFWEAWVLKTSNEFCTRRRFHRPRVGAGPTRRQHLRLAIRQHARMADPSPTRSLVDLLADDRADRRALCTADDRRLQRPGDRRQPRLLPGPPLGEHRPLRSASPRQHRCRVAGRARSVFVCWNLTAPSHDVAAGGSIPACHAA
jgi:hypothetical protein